MSENKKNELPEHVIYFDTETHQEKIVNESNIEIKQTLKLGWACYVRRSKGNETIKGEKGPIVTPKHKEWCYFENTNKFAEFVDSKTKNGRRLYLIAHNVGFDLIITNFYHEFPKRGWKLKKFYDEGTTHISIWKKEKKTICVIDSMNYFKTSLEKLGEQIGFSKMKIDFEKCTKNELKTYCKNDVEVLVASMENWFKFHTENDLGNFGMTVAGQSLNTFRHRFMRHKIFIHNNEKVYKLERASYFGGRTEAFHIGKINQKIYMVDVNSMYPSVMVDCEFPTTLRGMCENITISELERLLKSYLVIAEVDVECDVPIFPMRYNKKLIFPVGDFTCVIPTPEVVEGLKRGFIKKVKKVAVYEKAKIFTEYVNFFYNKRLEAKTNKDEINTFFFKLLLNSLYGKFGQKTAGWEIVDYTDDLIPKAWVEYDPAENKRTSYRQFAGCIQRMKDGYEESIESFPAIASHVTGYARQKLFSYMEIAGRENVFYCDTDSIFCTESGYINLEKAGLIDVRKLGMLGLDGIAGHGEIFGLKDYVMDEKIKLKGVKKNAEHIGENEEGKQVFKQEMWKRISGLIHDGNICEHRILTTRKILKREYDKGIVSKNGKVFPYKFNEGEIINDI